MALDPYNPLKYVGGSTVKCPSKYVYKLQDVSQSNAGRTDDGKMHKLRIGQCVKLELEWPYVTTAELAVILTAFNPEYISVEYLDGLTGAYQTKEFYVGDRSAPAYNTKMGLWENVAFNIIERTCSKPTGATGATGATGGTA